jgi:hypothetical protein
LALATSTKVYIQNRFPHKALEEKTQEEVFTGKKPSVDYLIIFGSPVYIHVPKEKRTKSLLERKTLLWGTMRPQKHIESMCQGKNI